MATAATLDAELATLIEALSSSPSRMPSDYDANSERIAPGDTHYQLQVPPAGRSGDSNVTYVQVLVVAKLHHRLSDPTDERAWSNGAMSTDLAAITVRSFWEAAAAAHELVDAIEVENDRVGNIVSTTVSLVLTVTP